MKIRSDVIDMTGRTYGHLKIIRLKSRKRFRTQTKLLWEAECLMCGSVFDVEGAHVRQGRTTRCSACSQALREVTSTTYVNGISVLEIAKRAGIKPNSAWKRVKRGWDPNKVDEPKVPPFSRTKGRNS
jgi:hypothetical protein